MVTLSISDLKARVRLMLDEQGINEGEFAEETYNAGEHDESYLDNIIDGKAVEALRYVYLNADASLVPWESLTANGLAGYVDEFSAARVYEGGPLRYYLSFSASAVLRWLSVKIEGWSRMVPCEEAIEVNSPQYAMLSDKYCTGTPERPRVAIEHYYAGSSSMMYTKLYLYSTPYTESTLPSYTLRFVTAPDYETTQTSKLLRVDDRLEDAFFYYLAGLTCMVLGDDRQEGFFQQAAELMGKTVNNEQ